MKISKRQVKFVPENKIKCHVTIFSKQLPKTRLCFVGRVSLLYFYLSKISYKQYLNMYAKQLTVFKKIPIGPGGRMFSFVGFLVVRAVVVTAVGNEGSVVAEGLIDVVLRVGVMSVDEDFGAGED